MNKLKLNFIYATAYKLLEMLLPLITSPLLSRRLGAESLGIYTYTYSFVGLFVLYAELGSYRYGIREIAKVQGDEKSRNQVYSDIYATHAANGLMVLAVYLCTIFVIQSEYETILLLQSMCIVSNMIDNSFLYVGMEDMKAITTRDAVIKIGTFVLIVFLIKSPDDLITYVVIMNICGIICKVVALCYGRKYVHFMLPHIQECTFHYKRMFVLMIPVVAAGIYQSMDKLMIGALYNKADVGYYECASKALISRNIITVFGTVLCPRITTLYAQERAVEARQKIIKAFKISMVMAYAFMFGIMAVANEFAPMFWGRDFSVCSSYMIGLSVSIPLWAVGEIIRTQYLLPRERDHEYMASFIIGVIVNALANLALIPRFGAMGAIVATLAAELVMSMVQLIMVRKDMKLGKELIETVPYFIMGVIMLISVRWLAGSGILSGIILVLAEIITGIVIYTGLVIGYEVLFKKRLMLEAIRR